MGVHRRLRDEIGQSNNATSSVLTVNIDWRECGCRLEADAVGDKAVVGTAATVEQNLTEELEKVVRLEMDDRIFLRTNEILEQRDDRR